MDERKGIGRGAKNGRIGIEKGIVREGGTVGSNGERGDTERRQNKKL